MLILIEIIVVGAFGAVLLSRAPLAARLVLPVAVYAAFLLPSLAYSAVFWQVAAIVVFVICFSASVAVEVIRRSLSAGRRARRWGFRNAVLCRDARQQQVVEVAVAVVVAIGCCAAVVAADLPGVGHSKWCSYLARALAIAAPLYLVAERARALVSSRTRTGKATLTVRSFAGKGRQLARSAIVDLAVSEFLVPFHLRPRWRVVADCGGELVVLNSSFTSKEGADQYSTNLAVSLNEHLGGLRERAVRVRVSP